MSSVIARPFQRRRDGLRILIVAATAVVLTTSQVGASPLLMTSVSNSIGSSFAIGENCGDGAFGGTPAFAQCMDSFYVNVSGIETLINMSATGSAHVNYGSLGAIATALAQITDNPGGGQVGASALALAKAQDTFVLQNATGGVLQFLIEVTGTQGLSATGNGGWSGGVGANISNTTTGQAFSGPGMYFFDVPFSGGTATTGFQLATSASCTVYGGTLCDGFANYGSTANILQVQVLDANGVVIPGATFTAESGFAYPTGPLQPVPEPSSLLLLGAGVLLFVKKVAKQS